MPAEQDAISQSGLPLIHQLKRAGEPTNDHLLPRLDEALRLSATLLSGFQKEAIVRSVQTGLTWRLVSDEGANLHGFDSAPPPLGFFSAGLAASYMEEILALAALRKIAIDKLSLTVDNFYSMQGSMPKGTMVGGAVSVALSVEIACDLSGPELGQFLINAISAAPQNGLITGNLESVFTLSLNDKEIAPNRVSPLIGPALAPTNASHSVAPAASDLVLLRKLGPSPASLTHPAPTDDGEYSTTRPADRPLHVSAIAVLRDDGLKEIRQQLNFPHGSEWCFLSAEASTLAPDANTLMAAGIGFCFMTQLGILAKAQKLDLPDYQIIQDSHLSLGGASGGTGKSGTAYAVETHLHLTSSEPVETAQRMLDLAEQACFLHALCRAGLKTKLKIKELDRNAGGRS